METNMRTPVDPDLDDFDSELDDYDPSGSKLPSKKI